MRTLSLVILLLLSGCATIDDNEFGIRIVEYGAQGPIVYGSPTIGGCSVYQAESPSSAKDKQSVRISMIYRGKNCTVNVHSNKIWTDKEIKELKAKQVHVPR